MKHRQNYSFVNWAKNLKAEIPHYFEPETSGEIASIINRFEEIRVVGAGHSWSEICLSGEALLNLDCFDRVLEIDQQNQVVKVEAGIKLRKLNEILEKERLAMRNLGSVSSQSLAGAISTGTHGTGIDYQVLGSQVIEFSIVKANGKKVTINRKVNPGLFNGATINLGCLGVITDMTIDVSESFNLHEYTETLLFEEVVRDLDRLIAENDHLKFWWLPPAEKLIVFKYNRSREEVNDSRLRQIWKDSFSSVVFYRTLVKIAKRIPQTANTFNKLLTHNFRGPLDRIEKSYKVFNVPEPPMHRETEWAFDLNRAQEILTAYRQRLIESKFKFNFVQEIRITGADDFWLSPSYGRDSLWIGFYNYEHEGWDELLPFHEEFAKKFDGRPHWGKEFTVGSGYLKEKYNQFEDFAKLRREFDPAGKFENSFISRLFG